VTGPRRHNRHERTLEITMRIRGPAGLGLALLALAACSDPVSPRARSAPSGPSATLVNPPPCSVDCPTGGSGGGSYAPLTVSVSGPSYVSSAGNANYTAATSGGTGSISSYVWTEYVCYGASNSPCESKTLDPYGTWYIHHYIASNVCTDQISVWVTDSGGHTAAASKTTSGPACLM
jgi:hypothetical protein